MVPDNEDPNWDFYGDPPDITCCGCEAAAVGFLRVSDYLNPDGRIFVCGDCADFAGSVLADVAYIDWLDDQAIRRRQGSL